MSMITAWLHQIFFIFLLFSCSGAQDFIFVVDTSGSMKKDERISNVKKSMREIAHNNRGNSRVHLVLFDEDVTEKGVYHLDDQSLLEFYDTVDRIEANGQWTNLIGALDHTLKMSAKVKKEHPSSRDIKLVIYTDGKHDLPESHPDKKNLNFEHLFNTYFQGLKQEKLSWFIYYVEIAEPDKAIKRFIKETNRGTIISNDDFTRFPDITKLNYAFLYQPVFYFYSFIIFLSVFILYYLFKPWFKKNHWAYIASAKDSKGVRKIHLGAMKRKVFRNYLTIGKEGEISVRSSALSKADAGIGIDITGQFFVKTLSGCPVKVNDIMVNKKRRFRLNDTITIGDASLTLRSEK